MSEMANATVGFVALVLIGCNVWFARDDFRSVGWTLFWSVITGVLPVTLFFLVPRIIDHIKYKRSRRKTEEFYKTPEGKRQLKESRLERAKNKLHSDLTDISGVSDKLARTLMDQYPNLHSIKSASVEQLSDIPGVGQSLAKAIKARLG
jgi:hypothetical protein